MNINKDFKSILNRYVFINKYELLPGYIKTKGLELQGLNTESNVKTLKAFKLKTDQYLQKNSCCSD